MKRVSHTKSHLFDYTDVIFIWVLWIYSVAACVCARLLSSQTKNGALCIPHWIESQWSCCRKWEKEDLHWMKWRRARVEIRCFIHKALKKLCQKPHLAKGTQLKGKRLCMLVCGSQTWSRVIWNKIKTKKSSGTDCEWSATELITPWLETEGNVEVKKNMPPSEVSPNITNMTSHINIILQAEILRGYLSSLP